ncbi:unnamed protein product [Plutella xylostella]|uniref:(diamondback moth) hypothetical protein n=1 Tax=Plutella xylostella TaxID=51655 RepID=A0A8S4E135_PLUXY|nr:unnamed protein product [Plutella xylostella]
MMNYESIQYLLYKLRSCDAEVQSRILKEIKSNINLLTSVDVSLLLDFLNTAYNIEIEAKVFSILALCLAIDDTHYETIVAYHAIYEKIENMLSKGLPSKTTAILNFICLLVYTEGGEGSSSVRRTLATQAKHMIRASGSLSVMASLLASSMVFLDTWKALCRCLAECCRDCQPNKAHCAHLIPLCVHKCGQGFTEVLEVLHAILSDNPRNISLFLNSNGMQIFTRDILQHLPCLQVLSSVVQSSTEAARAIRQLDVLTNIADILKWNGPQSQKGQWCTIILYYLESSQDKNENTAQVQLNESKMHEKEDTLPHPTLPQGIASPNAEENKTKESMNDTTSLIRNVVKEMLYWKAKDEADERMKPYMSSFIAKPKVQQNEYNIAHVTLTRNFSALFTPKENIQQNLKLHAPNPFSNVKNLERLTKATKDEEELSFSFLQKENNMQSGPRMYHHQQELKVPEQTTKHLRGNTKQTSNIKKAVREISVQTLEATPASTFKADDDKSTTNSNNFKPTIMSTPKRHSRERSVRHDSRLSKHTSRTIRKNKTHSYLQAKQFARQFRKEMSRTKKQESSVKTLSTRSMSSSFMSVVNESCTALANTVRSVFMPWSKLNATSTTKQCDTSKQSTKTVAHSANSFMTYMRKRDAILGNISDVTDAMEVSRNVLDDNIGPVAKDENPCNTCNDTAMLKEKMADNVHLKKTVKKLKLAINLYGCDFKKISKTFWPHDAYMTPSVLYNLYRKLILK